jgi:MbtH protein
MNHSADHYLNPFDDDTQTFIVLSNTWQQYSLWPLFVPCPPGWQKCYGPNQREQCLHYIEQHWHSINPFERSRGRDTNSHTDQPADPANT